LNRYTLKALFSICSDAIVGQFHSVRAPSATHHRAIRNRSRYRTIFLLRVLRRVVMSDGGNELRRLSATWLNTIASGVVTAGSCGSLIAYSFGPRPGITALQVLAVLAVTLTTGAVLHLLARALLNRC